MTEHLRSTLTFFLASVLLGFVGGGPGQATPLRALPVFASDPTTHSLDLLFIAGPKPLTFPFGIKTTGWVYQVCPRPADAGANDCPAGTSVQPLGGVRLALRPGDTFKMRLVNRLPVVQDSKYCAVPGHSDLVNNPTNIHFHGMLVEPHRAQGPGDTYGDYSFLEIRNPDNTATCPGLAAVPEILTPQGPLPTKICTAPSNGAVHADMDVIDRAADYAIELGSTHPTGLFWYHPHMHGISMNQMTSGLSGMISVGGAADMCADAACRSAVASGDERFLTLQDMQIEANGHFDTQQNAGFCNGSNDKEGGVAAAGSSTTGAGASAGVTRQTTAPPAGSCFEIGKPGRWFHTVNGQLYPTIDVGPRGAIWRMLNASASRTYDLSLVGADGYPVPLQVLSVDGVPIESQASANPAMLAQLLGGKVSAAATCRGGSGLCVPHVLMMPSARIEVRVVNPASTSQQANLQTAEVKTGASGDDWPAISLAAAALAAPAADTPAAIAVAGTRALFQPGGALAKAATMQLAGTTTTVSPAQARSALGAVSAAPAIQASLRQATAYAIDPQLATGARKDASCAPLAAGHRRRIYFGYVAGAQPFGLGYVELDGSGKEVAGTARPVTPYDPAKVSICLPLAAGNQSATEVWELVNLTAEDHNFHLHQVRFSLLASENTRGSTKAAFVVHDNLPLPHGSAGCDGTLATAVAIGTKCRTTTQVIRISFGEIGDFVYHCHIMEHEDGGMMAHIRVVPGD